MTTQPKNPLHGVTLKAMLEYLVAEYGWEEMSSRITINCFAKDPSINSSLTFYEKLDINQYYFFSAMVLR